MFDVPISYKHHLLNVCIASNCRLLFIQNCAWRPATNYVTQFWDFQNPFLPSVTLPCPDPYLLRIQQYPVNTTYNTLSP